MSDAAVRGLATRRPSVLAIRLWPWIIALLVAVVLPWLFYDWQHHRQSGFMLSMFSQIGMLIIFALSFNMLRDRQDCCHSAILSCSVSPAIRLCIS